MQANTDYDFGYSHSANGTMSAVAEPDGIGADNLAWSTNSQTTTALMSP